jgi:N-acetylglucosaminyldiphosphoundecaprenol N-acetyl-beta-D-mannosaminyltransferase
MSVNERYSVIGVRISRETMASALDRVLKQCSDGGGGYVCFTNAHVAVMAREDPGLRGVINGSFLSLPDGKPVYLSGKIRGISQLEHISGPEFFGRVLASEKSSRLRHYFYGGRSEVLECLLDNIKRSFPHADIVGYESPPFRALTEAEASAVNERIRSVKPDVVWVGLGAPKQELWMASHWSALRPALLLGVGAAFDFYAGSLNRAPVWMQRAGMEWVYRLWQEPKRLWRRYFYTNTMFILYTLSDLLRR